MKGHIIMKKLSATVAALSVVGLVAGCGSVGDTDLAGDTGAESGGLTDITVGVIPTADAVPVYLGIEDGIFEEHGLNVTVESAGGGAAITSSVLSGSIDIGLSNLVSTYTARDKDFPITIIAPTAAAPADPDNNYGAVLAAPDSGIEEVLDLEGKTVATNALNNANDILVREAVEQAGGDPDSIQFVEIAFQDQPGAVSSGRVDAAASPEPFKTMALDSGATPVFSHFAEVIEGYPTSIYLATDEYVGDNAETLQGFRDALYEAAAIANEDDARAREVMSGYTEMEDDLLERIVLPVWPTELDEEAVFDLYDLTAKYGVIEDSVEDREALVTIP